MALRPAGEGCRGLRAVPRATARSPPRHCLRCRARGWRPATARPATARAVPPRARPGQGAAQPVQPPQRAAPRLAPVRQPVAPPMTIGGLVQVRTLVTATVTPAAVEFSRHGPVAREAQADHAREEEPGPSGRVRGRGCPGFGHAWHSCTARGGAAVAGGAAAVGSAVAGGGEVDRGTGAGGWKAAGGGGDRMVALARDRGARPVGRRRAMARSVAASGARPAAEHAAAGCRVGTRCSAGAGCRAGAGSGAGSGSGSGSGAGARSGGGAAAGGEAAARAGGGAAASAGTPAGKGPAAEWALAAGLAAAPERAVAGRCRMAPATESGRWRGRSWHAFVAGRRSRPAIRTAP